MVNVVKDILEMTVDVVKATFNCLLFFWGHRSNNNPEVKIGYMCMQLYSKISLDFFILSLSTESIPIGQ